MPILFPPRDYSAENGYSGNVLDRRAESRTAETLGQALADPNARIIAMCELDVLFSPSANSIGLPISALEKINVERPSLLLLGWDRANHPWLAVRIPPEHLAEAVAQDYEAIALRPIASDPRLSHEEIGAAAQARSLLGWHKSHRFCSNCGQESEMALAGYRRDCPACGTPHFPRTDPVVIMLVIDGERVLLGRQPRFAPGNYSCLAGFMEPGETIENAVRREVWEEAGIRAGRVSYFSSQPWPFVSSLMIGCFAEATSFDIQFDATELDDCRWFTRDDVALMVENRHPDGRYVPNSSAIARKLIEHWLANT